MTNSIKERLCQIISEVKGYRITQSDIVNGSSLYKQLRIDSLLALQIIVLIEKEFGIHIDDDQIAIEILESLDKASCYIEEATLQEPD